MNRGAFGSVSRLAMTGVALLAGAAACGRTEPLQPRVSSQPSTSATEGTGSGSGAGSGRTTTSSSAGTSGSSSRPSSSGTGTSAVGTSAGGSLGSGSSTTGTTGTLPRYAGCTPCSDDADCPGGFCFPIDLTHTFCAASCRDNADCASGECAAIGVSGKYGCVSTERSCLGGSSGSTGSGSGNLGSVCVGSEAQCAPGLICNANQCNVLDCHNPLCAAGGGLCDESTRKCLIPIVGASAPPDAGPGVGYGMCDPCASCRTGAYLCIAEPDAGSHCAPTCFKASDCPAGASCFTQGASLQGWCYPSDGHCP